MSTTNVRKGLAQSNVNQSMANVLVFQHSIMGLFAGMVTWNIVIGLVVWVSLGILTANVKSASLLLNLFLALCWGFMFYTMAAPSGLLVAISSGAFTGFIAYCINASGTEGLRDLSS